jgi:hypothetical protein
MRASRRYLAPWLVVGVVLGLACRAAAIPAFDHSDYDAFLAEHVREGLVDYGGIKKEGVLLAGYLRKLEQVSPDDFRRWQRNARIAFWINAYNAITIHGIVMHYPIEYGGPIARIRFPKSSIRQIARFWDTVFVRVMGAEITLDDIEHEILRKEFGDPRIHFAVVCAAMGCPVLSSDAYRGDLLEQQLERDARRFINDEEKVRLDVSENKVYLSSLFKWYAGDFSAAKQDRWLREYSARYRGLMHTVAEYLRPEERDYLIEHSPRLEFLDYDWSLNDLTEDARRRGTQE